MYPIVLLMHSWMRYIVVVSIVCTLARALYGWLAKAEYTGMDDVMRLITVSAGHLQIVIGFALYFSSPLLDYFRSNTKEALAIPDLLFFGVIHIALMFVAAVVMTIGGARARRMPDHEQRFRTIALYFLAAAVIIVLAVPWPFSPLAARPWLRL